MAFEVARVAKHREMMQELAENAQAQEIYASMNKGAKAKFKKRYIATGSLEFVETYKASAARKTTSHTEKLNEKSEPQL